MNTTYTIYRADGTQEEGSVDWPHEPGYQMLKDLIGPIVGGPLEHVAVLHNEHRKDMFVDEIGHIRKEPKPYNEAATEIYRAHSVSQGAVAEDLPTIVGDVVLFHRLVWF